METSDHGLPLLIEDELARYLITVDPILIRINPNEPSGPPRTIEFAWGAAKALDVLLIAYVPSLTAWPQHFEEPQTGPTIEEIWGQEMNAGQEPAPRLRIPEGTDLMQELMQQTEGGAQPAQQPGPQIPKAWT